MRFGWLPGGVSRSAKGPTEWVKRMRPVPSQQRNARALHIWWPVARREKSRQHPHHTHFVVRCCIVRASQVAVLERCTGLLSAHLHLVVRALAGRRKRARMTSAHNEDMELAGNVRRRCRCHPARVKSGQTPSESENVVHPVHTNCTTPPTTHCCSLRRTQAVVRVAHQPACHTTPATHTATRVDPKPGCFGATSLVEGSNALALSPAAVTSACPTKLNLNSLVTVRDFGHVAPP
jgi:hypothetical protein